MKKINVKKLVASIAALSAVACMAAIPASAVETPATYGESKKACAVAIGQATVTVDELKASNYQVPVIVKVTPNPKISILEFGVSSELPYKFLTTDDFTVDDDNNPTGKFAELKALKTAPAGLSLSIDMASNIVEDNGKNVAWLTWAAEKGKTTANFAVMVVDVPKDVKGGEEYELTYMNKGLSGNPELCALNEDGSEVDYAADGKFEGISGWIHVVAPKTEPTTEPPTTEPPTTQPPTTEPPTTQPPTTQPPTTEPPTTQPPVQTTSGKATTAKAYEPILNPHKDEYYTQTTPKAVPAATARGGGEGTSPKTGASDVLPIAGAAAAVAVLGGVALVTKKKND